MIQVFPASARFTSNHGWLKTSHSFSFANYYDPDNMRFGPMRVLNDDIVQPGEGFGEHPHREMEIVSIVLKGELQHTDSAGHSEIIHRGEVQRMTAGRGVYHSEMNPSSSEEVNFLQLWFEPAERGLAPSYEQITYDTAGRVNELVPVVSSSPGDQVAMIHQDLTLYLSEIEAGREILFSQAEDRKVFIFVMDGDLKLGEHALGKRDSARVQGVTRLQMATNSGAFFMLIDLPN